MTSHSCARKPFSLGFSLVELMVAISISLVLLIGLIQVFISSKRSYNIQDSIARMQENGRYAVDLLSKDLRLAGYMGGNADVTTIIGSEAPGNDCVGAADTAWGKMIEQSLFGLNDGLSNYTGCITAAGASPQPNDYLSGDVLVVRYARPTQLLTTDTVDSGGYYLNSSPMRGEIALLVKDGSIDFDSIDDSPKTYNKLEAYAYYTGNQEASCNGITTNVPSLSRLFLNNNGTPERQEIVRGIENLQMQYGIDTDNNGSPNQYVNASPGMDWSIVKSARLWLLVRDECPSSGYTNTNTYVMGDSDLVANDNFRRHLYTITVMLRNNEAI